jgi:hypothetical protein
MVYIYDTCDEGIMFNQTFIGIKVSLILKDESVLKDLFIDLVIVIENSEGKSLRFNFSTMNFNGSKNIDDLFYESLEKICYSAEDVTFEEYHGNIEKSKQTITELTEEYQNYQDFYKKLHTVVNKDWVTMIGCYLALQ